MKRWLFGVTVFSVLLLCLLWIEWEWIEHRVNGCHCPMDRSTGAIECVGHPAYPRLCPQWVRDRWEPMPMPPHPPYPPITEKDPLDGRYVRLVFRAWKPQRTDTIQECLYPGARFELVGNHHYIIVPNATDLGTPYESWVPLSDLAEIQIFNSDIKTEEMRRVLK